MPENALSGRSPAFLLCYQTVDLRILDEHNGFGIVNLPVSDHLNGFFKRNFHYLDVLLLRGAASAVAHFHIVGIFGDEEIEDFGNGAGRHVGLEYFFTELTL